MVNPLLDAKLSLQSELKKLKSDKSSIFGSKRRAISRQIATHVIHEHALQALEKYLPKMFHELPSSESFNEQWAIFINGLGSYCKSESAFREGLKFVLKCIQKGNESGIWLLDLPTIPLEISRTKLPYDEQWFLKSKRCRDFYDSWIALIEQGKRTDQAAETLLTDLLISAVFHCGIHTVQRLHLFAQSISKKQKFFSDDQHCWFELSACDETTNFIDDQGNKHTHSRVYLAFPTLGLIYRWFRNRKCTDIIPDTLKTFKLWFEQQLNVMTARRLSVEQLCRYSQLCTQLYPGVNYPQILSHVTSGKLSSVGVSHQHWLELHQPVQPSIETDQTFKRIQNLESDPKRKKGKYQIDRHSLFLCRLREAIKEKQNDTHKNTRKKAIQALTVLKNDICLTESEDILFGWLFHCINVKANKLSTLRTYLSQGGMQWLNCCWGQNIYSWTGDDFIARYREILGIEKFSSQQITEEMEDVNDSEIQHHSKETKQATNLYYLADRLESLHNYAVRYHGLAPLSESLLGYVNQKKHVRAGYISEPLFHHMRQLLKQNSFLTAVEKQRLECLAIIAFRAGLRISELLKLRVSDIEPSEEMWLYVRSTALDDNKSRNALRKIPLAVLLTPEESVIVKGYYLFRADSNTKSLAALMFPSEAGELIPLSEGDVQVPLQKLLNLCSQQLWTFHHFRHTAISRLQLLLHRDVLELHTGNKSLGSHLMAWDTSDCERIYQAIMSGHPRGDYWALAQFAGHQTPETTLQSYLHFSDWISAACLNQAQFDWGIAARHYFTGVSLSKLKQLGWDSGALHFARCFEAIKVHLKDYICHIDCIVRPLPSRIQAKPPKLDFFAMVRILTAYSQQADMSFLKNYYGIDESKFEHWLTKINALLQLKTTKAHLRLTYEARMNSLLPGKMRSHKEQDELVQIIEKARKLYRTHPMDLESWTQYQLMHCNQQNHALPFQHEHKLKAFITTSVKLIPAYRIGIVVYCAKSDRTRWSSGLPANIRIKYINSANASRALVRIIHPDEAGILERQSKKASVEQTFNQYSTPVFHYVAYIMALILFPLERIRSWSEQLN